MTTVVVWVGVIALLAVMSWIAFALGARAGRFKGFEEGWIAYRRQTDPNLPGGFSEHPTLRKANERRWMKQALDDLRAAQRHDREHWN
jgi:hypothetical protein